MSQLSIATEESSEKLKREFDAPQNYRQAEYMQPAGGSQASQNISSNERLFSTVGGSALLLIGLARGKLGGLLTSMLGGALLYRGWTGHCHCYETLGIDTSDQNSATAVPAQQGVKVEKTIAVNRSQDELYNYWSNLENLPKAMRHLKQVEKLSDGKSRWVAEGPFGKTVEWEAELINERAPEMIAWRSLPGSEIDTAGSVHFKSLGQGRGTAVTVSMKYNPPGGKIGAAVAGLFGSGLEQEMDEDLRRFKSQMEAGEIPTTQGQPMGA